MSTGKAHEFADKVMSALDTTQPVHTLLRNFCVVLFDELTPEVLQIAPPLSDFDALTDTERANAQQNVLTSIETKPKRSHQKKPA